MLKIESVEPGSYAAELGLAAGDSLIAINGKGIDDLLDYHLTVSAEKLVIEATHEDELWELELLKEREEDLGLEVEHPYPRQCGNQCLFCFVHQLPRGMRKTLYIKDEDFRFSYLYGSYITLTNVQEDDLQRIMTEQLSPLYISVHATEHTLRQTLLGTEIPELMPLIERLTAAGIVLHCQVVLCPGYNDGQALENTINDLASFYPAVASLAVVPVGLTRHREKLAKLAPVTDREATACLDLIGGLQSRFLKELGSRFVFAADELYLKAERDIPVLDAYEDCAQLENGVGLVARFRQQAEEVLLEAEPLDLGTVTLVTGTSFAEELQSFADRLALRTGVQIHVLGVENSFFGTAVSVTGLITGTDLLDQLQHTGTTDAVVIPDVMLRQGEELFLDDVLVETIQQRCNCPVVVIESSPWGLLEGLESLAEGPEVIHCQE